MNIFKTKKVKRNFGLLGILIVVFMSCSSPKALEYQTYHDFSIQSLGFRNSTIKVSLTYFNPNNFRMQLRNTDLDIFINGKLFGHSFSDSLIQIPKKDTFSLPVKFDVSMESLYQNALNTLLGKEVTVKVTGKIKIGKAKVFMYFPINYESKETFTLF